MTSYGRSPLFVGSWSIHMRKEAGRIFVRMKLDEQGRPLFGNAKPTDQPSVFTAENLLREARRQKGLAQEPVPTLCVLDPDGDVLDSRCVSTTVSHSFFCKIILISENIYCIISTFGSIGLC